MDNDNTVHPSFKDGEVQKNRIVDDPEFMDLYYDWYKHPGYCYPEIKDLFTSTLEISEEEKEENKKYEKLWRHQYHTRGYTDPEIINLDNTIANFIYPRLKDYIESIKKNPSIPGSIMSKVADDIILSDDQEKEAINLWLENLHKILKAFEIKIQGKDETSLEFKEGMELFAEHFNDLWL